MAGDAEASLAMETTGRDAGVYELAQCSIGRDLSWDFKKIAGMAASSQPPPRHLPTRSQDALVEISFLKPEDSDYFISP